MMDGKGDSNYARRARAEVEAETTEQTVELETYEDFNTLAEGSCEDERPGKDGGGGKQTKGKVRVVEGEDEDEWFLEGGEICDDDAMQDYSAVEADNNLCCFDGGRRRRTSVPMCFYFVPFCLPVYISPVFLNYVSWGLRSAIAATGAAAISIYPSMPSLLSAALFIAPITAVFASAPTLGRTLNLSWAIMAGSTVGALLSLALLAVLGQTETWWLAIGLFCMCWLCSYPIYHPIAFKMNTVVVAVVVLFYIQIPGLDWVLFPFYAVAAMGIGCGCGVVMQILPWPTRGSKELLEALGLSLNAASRGVQCAIGHFTANEKHDVERLYLSEKAQLMTQKIVENIAIAKARYEDAQWEHGLMSNPGFVKYIQTLEAMTEAMEGMYRCSMAAEPGYYHDNFVAHLRASFGRLSEAMALTLDTFSHKIMNKQIGLSSIRRQYRHKKMMRKEKERKKATNSRDRPKQEEVNNDDGDGDGDKESIDDKDLDIVARMDDILKTYERTRRQWFWHNSSESTKNLTNFNMKEVLPLAAFIFYLKTFIGLMKSLEEVKPHWVVDFNFVLTVFPLDILRDIVLWLAGLPKRLSKYAQDSRQGGRFAFLSIPAKCSIAWLRSDNVIWATQMSVAISVASILVFSSAIREWFPYGYWAVLTVCLVMDRKQGFSFRQTGLRILGTVLGATAGYLGVHISAENGLGILAFFFVWINICSYARGSVKSLDYPGAVAAYTMGLVMIVAKQPQTTSAELLALGRIESNFLGCLVIVGICLVWPVRSSNHLRYSLLPGSLTKIRELSSLIFDSFITPPASSLCNSSSLSSSSSGPHRRSGAGASTCAQPSDELSDLAGVTGTTLDEEEQGDEAGVLSEHHHVPPHPMETTTDAAAKAKPGATSPAVAIIKAIGGILVAQALHIESGAHEPQLWRAPFPADSYSVCLASQKKLLKQLIILDKVITSAKLEGRGIYNLLFPALLSSLCSIKVEVLGCMEELLKQLIPPKKPQSAMDQLEAMEGGQVRTRRQVHSFAPLRASMCLQSCERQLLAILRQTIKQFLKSPPLHADHLPISNMDALSLFTFLFTVRCASPSLSCLWPIVRVMNSGEFNVAGTSWRR